MTDAKKLDVQAGYEPILSFLAREQVGHSGSFVMADSTLENFSTALLDPIISVRGAKPQNALEQNIENQIQKSLHAYRSPEIPEECIRNMRKILLDYGIDEPYIDKIEHARR